MVTHRKRSRAAALADLVMRPAARWLDAKKMARLGIRNTMRIARRYNSLHYGRQQHSREWLWREHFDELVEENGGSGSAGRIRMKDGFALDSSGSLPYLDELLCAADELIAERAGTAPVDDRYRAFFRNLAEPGDTDRWPALVDFVTSSELIATAGEYLGTRHPGSATSSAPAAASILHRAAQC